MDEIKYHPIGIVHSPFKEPKGTPVLDIKPYIPEFTTNEKVKIGWLENNIHKLRQSKDDGRFI